MQQADDRQDGRLRWPRAVPRGARLHQLAGARRALLREDLVGSLAHLTMLSRTAIIPARAGAGHPGPARAASGKSAQAGTLQLPDEEDVHMAVESVLARAPGRARRAPAHGALAQRSGGAGSAPPRARAVRAGCSPRSPALIDELADRAEAERDTLLPSYTHRQRAQPISLAYLLCAYGAMFARDVDALLFVLEQVIALPLGVGAIAGTSLPIDRELTRAAAGLLARHAQRPGHRGQPRLRARLRLRRHALLLHASRAGRGRHRLRDRRVRLRQARRGDRLRLEHDAAEEATPTCSS